VADYRAGDFRQGQALGGLEFRECSHCVLRLDNNAQASAYALEGGYGA